MSEKNLHRRYAYTPTCLHTDTPILIFPRRFADTPIQEDAGINIDEIAGIKLLQTPKGVKASVDGLLLARFAGLSPGWSVADLGCGNGLIGLLLAKENPRCRFLGLEIQAELIRQAAASALLNGLDNIRFVQADLRSFPWSENLSRFNLVLANPPYRKTGTGRISPDPERAGARHEIFGSVRDFAIATAALLKDGGGSTWVYLAERYKDLVSAVADAGLTPVCRRYVVSRKGDKPNLVLFKALKGNGPGAVREEEPLVLYRSKGGRDYTDEAREMIYGIKGSRF